MIVPKKTICICLTLLIGLVISQAADGANCNPGQAISRAKWSKFGKVSKVISVETFQNQSKDKSSNSLSTAIPEYVGDLFATAKNVGVSKGIAKKFPPSLIKSDYFITGSYQKTGAELRVHINVFGASNPSASLFQTGFAISPPNTGRLFIELEKATKGIFAALKLSFDKKAFMREALDTANFDAYQSYIRGLEAMWQFHPNHLDVAIIWLSEARKQDPYFQKPYLALADIYGYLALQAKALGKPYDQYLQKLRVVERERLSFSNRPSPLAKLGPGKTKKGKNPNATNRILNGDSHFIAGVTALRSGNLKQATKELEIAVKLVPEDSVALRELVGALARMGKPKEAAEYKNKIFTQGMCH